MREYQFDQYGYYIGEAENPGSTPSHNCTFTAPVQMTGYIPQWNGSIWNQIENHVGEKVWVDGAETEIKEYGPLPEGASLTPPPPTLEEVKAAKLAEISAAKWNAIETGEVAYQGLSFHTDTASQGLLGNAILMYQALGTLPQVWKAKDGGYLTVTSIGQLTAIGALVAAYVEGLFGTEYALRQQVEAAETVEQVEAISWTAAVSA